MKAAGKLAGALLALSVAGGVLADTVVLQPGEALPILSLKDQHEQPAPLPATTRQILFAADNAGARLVMALLDARPASWLTETQRVYLADIHRMPGLVTRLVALPELRGKAYRIVLGREAGDLAMLPRRPACVSLIAVDAGKLGETAYACDAEALAAAMN